MSTGFDHRSCRRKKRKIPVCNVPTYGENTVAEHKWRFIITFAKTFPFRKTSQEGVFNYDGLRGFDLKAKTLGVIGTGHIGAHVIRMAKSFEMNVIAYDPFPNKALARQLDFTYVPFAKLLSTSDVITLHVPLLKETTHLINKTNVKKIKPGAYLINTARGGLIETEALVWAIETGRIAGAGLDVLEEEEDLQYPDHLVRAHHTPEQIKTVLMDNRLIDHPNVIITPHNAFNSLEALQRIMDTTIANVKAFTTEKIQNDVTMVRK